MPPIIMYRERIARWIRTRLSRAQFNELEVSIPTRSLADCITIMSEFEFSVHTGTSFIPGASLWGCPTSVDSTSCKKVGH